jgi:hypothetical protein
VASVKYCEGYGGIFMRMGTNENSSCVQTSKLHFFFAPHYISFCAAGSLLSIMCSEIVLYTHKHCHGDGFDASNCADFDSYSLCCLLNLGFGYNPKFYTCWLRKGHELLYA